MPDQEFQQYVSESIKLIFDLTSRIDERVKFLVHQQENDNERTDKLVSKVDDIAIRVFLLEKKMSNGMASDLENLKKEVDSLRVKFVALDIYTNINTGKWGNVGSFIVKVVISAIGVLFTTGAGLLMWKLGINP